jgi:ATP-dependent Lhr-like helicase
VVRDEHELHDALLTLVVLPAAPEWSEWFQLLVQTGRASALRGQWVATERLSVVDDVLLILRGWMDSLGPVTAAALAARLELSTEAVEIELAQLESEGVVLRGRFSTSKEEFCHRRVLARIHRMTLSKLRREIEPVTAADFMRFLTRWQHTEPGTRLHGADGLLQVLRQLQGYEISAAAWELSVLPQRVAKYDPELLDRCASGEVMGAIVAASRAGDSYRAARSADEVARWRSSCGRTRRSYARRRRVPVASPGAGRVAGAASPGALFFNELLRATGRLASEVEDGLWELVAGGLVTGDGFENLRALIDPRAAAARSRADQRGSRHAWRALGAHGSSFDRDRHRIFAQQLLTRWGVVFRDMLARETLAPTWRELLQVYRRMEARGEIRGGRFVAGFLGEQFARPEALDMLRHVRRSEKSAVGFEIAPADPLNLTGIILPGARTGALTQTAVRIVEARAS